MKSRTDPVQPLEWKALKNQLKPSSVKPTELELKELPEHLEYGFLQEDNQLLIFISSALSTIKKARLLEAESYEGVSPEMRRHKSFNNVTADHQEGIMVLPQPQGKSLKPGSTGQISSAMHVDWSELVMRVNEPVASPQEMKHLKIISKSSKYSMSGE
ncbi:hypothetical protein Tco_1206552 [Tanacetum coccineum]